MTGTRVQTLIRYTVPEGSDPAALHRAVVANVRRLTNDGPVEARTGKLPRSWGRGKGIVR